MASLALSVRHCGADAPTGDSAALLVASPASVSAVATSSGSGVIKGRADVLAARLCSLCACRQLQPENRVCWQLGLHFCRPERQQQSNWRHCHPLAAQSTQQCARAGQDWPQHPRCGHCMCMQPRRLMQTSKQQLRSPCLCLAEPAATSACERGISLQQDRVFIQIWLQELLIYVARLWWHVRGALHTRDMP